MLHVSLTDTLSSKDHQLQVHALVRLIETNLYLGQGTKSDGAPLTRTLLSFQVSVQELWGSE